jgi:uncharacterized damage-inducible protein DinB
MATRHAYILAGVSLAKELLLTDVRYSGWANQCLLDACSRLTAEEIARDLRISHASILSTLQHIHDAERVWLDCLQANPETGPWRLPHGSPPKPWFDALRRSWPELSNGYRRWIQDSSEADLGVELKVLLPDEAEPSLPRWKILRHALEHSTLHRGQIIGMIRMLGHTPPPLDRMDFYLAGDGSAS